MSKQRAAAPAFQFYPSDFMTGAPAHMTPEETHVYIWLLCLDWQRVGFVFDEKALAHFCRMTRPRFRKAWAIVSQSFVARDGRMFNPRLEKERAKQAEWRDKSAEGGRRGAARRWPQKKQGGIQGANRGGIQGGLTTGNTKRTHFSLQTEVGVITTPATSDEPPRALNGALDRNERNQAELEDLNRRREARGERPLTYAEAYGGR